jgi:hypothetical protein
MQRTRPCPVIETGLVMPNQYHRSCLLTLLLFRKFLNILSTPLTLSVDEVLEDFGRADCIDIGSVILELRLRTD